MGEFKTMKTLLVAGCVVLAAAVIHAETVPESSAEVGITTDRRIADLKSAFEEITESFRQRAIELEQKGNADRDAAIAAKDAAMVEREAVVAERDAAIAAKDAAMVEREAVVAERDAAIIAKDAALAECDHQRKKAEDAETERQSLAARLSEMEPLQAEVNELREGRLALEKEKDAEIGRLQEALVAAQQSNARERFALAYNLGSIYKAARQYDRAETQFLKALEMNADDPALHYNLGILYDDNFSDSKKAKYHYERFLALAPNDPDAPNVIKWVQELDEKWQ